MFNKAWEVNMIAVSLLSDYIIKLGFFERSRLT